MKKDFDEKYSKDLNNPSYISKCQKTSVQKKIKGFFIKEILPQISEIEEINNSISLSWDELLDKILNAKVDVDPEVVEVVMDIALQQKIIEESTSKISSFSEKL